MELQQTTVPTADPTTPTADPTTPTADSTLDTTSAQDVSLALVAQRAARDEVNMLKTVANIDGAARKVVRASFRKDIKALVGHIKVQF